MDTKQCDIIGFCKTLFKTAQYSMILLDTVRHNKIVCDTIKDDMVR